MIALQGTTRRVSELKHKLRTATLPKPLKTPPQNAPIVVAGLFRTASGIGQSARACFDGLVTHGLDPIAVDLSMPFNQVDTPLEEALGDMPSKSGILLLHVNAPETEPALIKLGLSRLRRWHVVGYWAWELPVPRPDWLPATRYLSEIWTPSTFVTNAFQSAVDIPVKTAPHFVRPPIQQIARSVHESNAPICLLMADGRSSFHRKNVLGGIRMFRNALVDRPDARLTVKLRNIDDYPAFNAAIQEEIGNDARVTVLNGSVPSAERWSILSRHNILLSPHRSEGFGLHIAEAMALGSCVVATGWSGNLEFMSPDTSVLLPYTLEPASDPFGVYDPPEGAVWAAVDEAAAISALQVLAADPDRRRALGKAAKAHITTTLNGSAYVEGLETAAHASG